MSARSRPIMMRRGQRGAAALIVVMLLFFIISLVAAYTSRNLIFEQRTATNQYRSTQAMEAAEAGVEWTIAQLNAGRISNTCAASTDVTNESFRQRYLTINSSSGQITRRLNSDGTVLRPECVFDGSGGGVAWRCRCPKVDTTTAALTSPTGTGTAVAPAFVIQFTQGSATLGGRTDLIQLESNSCTRLGTDCLNFNTNRGGTGDGVASVRVTLALRGALNRVPAAALTVMGAVASVPTGVVLAVSNQDVATNGITVHAAGSLPGSGLNLSGMPGTAPASTTISGDTALLPAAQTVAGFTATDLRFASFFGMTPQTYLDQPGLPQLDCSAGCDSGDIEDVLKLNRGRPIWLTGSTGTVTIDADLGTNDQPALLIIDGDLVLGSGATLRGMIYHRAKPGGGGDTTWNLSGTATVQGAAIVEGGLTLAGSSATPALVYNPAVLKALRVSTGTFVRVPGSWRDFL